MVPPATDPVRSLAAQPAVRRAAALIHRTDARTLEDQRTLAQIGAPSFGEARRAEWIAQQFDAIGLGRVERDGVGNVLARANGHTRDAPPVIVAAHLDTVFPDTTELNARIEGGRLYLPGIADNARGLAGMLAIARAIRACEPPLQRPILFVATVGEEGVGDLRGVKHLFDSPAMREAAAFIALDGTDSRRIVTRAVGSTRFRVTVRGPGGHSWADRGTANPAHTIGAAIVALSELPLPAGAPASLNVGRIGGGTSVNAIPESAWLELDLRSEDPATLQKLERHATNALHALVARSQAGGGGDSPLRLEIETIGRRPAGATPPDSPLVHAARAATRHIGRRPELVASSTDANVPMALAVPAIAIGAGGESGGTHTLQEWYDNRRGPDGIIRALLTTLAAANG